ncbi:hypothetical protein GOB87_04925 [Acetobacter estunensis]|uniref:Uncharacterized protein n=1 Tax=Acetobacter estunensis TaxID=104097 RepID=A0A967ECU8_9PROT|nr:hypothetical protein [Acetobacter estunensis]NHO53305.1 hypothetical protein [Acetobacter estunensis]
MSAEAYWWSPTTLCFYLGSSHREYGANWPSDTVPVSAAVFQQFGLNYPPTGKQRGRDANGMPTWVDA